MFRHLGEVIRKKKINSQHELIICLKAIYHQNILLNLVNYALNVTEETYAIPCLEKFYQYFESYMIMFRGQKFLSVALSREKQILF